ncbi:alpha/beta hydrolase, partial [Demequina sp. TTPB684]|nr:alpha/beta hydrolase [Demequina sp. TTPB684]
MAELTEIRAMTVLPAHRENIEIVTEDGLTLVGELALPASGNIAATLVTLHPLPTHGGFMDSHVLRKASWRLPYLADVAVLRFNTRGTSSPRGTSGG